MHWGWNAVRRSIDIGRDDQEFLYQRVTGAYRFSPEITTTRGFCPLMTVSTSKATKLSLRFELSFRSHPSRRQQILHQRVGAHGAVRAVCATMGTSDCGLHIPIEADRPGLSARFSLIQ